MMIYFDTSVVVTFYCPEPIGDEVEALIVHSNSSDQFLSRSRNVFGDFPKG